MDTSKTRSIKSLLLQAWRERWSDVMWGIRIKSVLPRGVSGDVYDLADCILQQALVGPGPNNLFMLYLMHSLSSRVVSYGAVLSSIGRYQSYYKPYCILSLLDLLKTFQSRIGCHGNEEECIALCKAVVSVTHWLYSCVFHSMTKLAEMKQNPEHTSIMEKSYEALYHFSNSKFIKSLLYVGKFEDQSMYTQMLQKHRELENKLNQVPNIGSVSKEMVEGALSLVGSVDNLPNEASKQCMQPNKMLQVIASTLNIMVGFDAILNPASDVSPFVNQLLLMKKMQGFTLSQLYCEIIRACFIGVHSTSSQEDLKWSTFTFLKVPLLISKIHSMQVENEEDALEKGLDILLTYVPLLDLTDIKSNCDCFQYLTNEFFKIGMLSEAQKRRLVTRRQTESNKHSVMRQDHQGSEANVNLILRAEKTVTSILKSLEPDYSKIQEKLLVVLCCMAGKNFELILSAAAATGKLHIISAKLIQLNEYNKHITSESAKASSTRGLLFDVTFLMLCHITQHYGIEVVTANADKKDSFFVTWASECLAEGGKFKSPDLMLSRCDPAIVETLVAQLMNTELDLKASQVKLHEICINAPAAVREILVAWEHGALSTEKVKVILDHIKNQLCFLPVCISAWLCSYLDSVHHQLCLKPMNVLQQFAIVLNADSTTSPSEESPVSGSGRQTPQMPGSDQANAFYKERSTLMVGIISKMILDVCPRSQSDSKTAPRTPHGLTARIQLGKILDDVFDNAHLCGWLDLNTIHYFESLFIAGGARWLCQVLVEKILNYQYSMEINRAVDMVIGIFYLDIEQCALALLLHVLPFYLSDDIHQEQLAEPYGSALSRLTVITTYAALQSRQCPSTMGVKTGCKRAHSEIDIDDTRDHTEHSRPSKIHRSNAELMEDTPFELQSLNDDQLRNAINNPINKAIANLMKTLLHIASDTTISARSLFPIRFLEQVVSCAKDQAHAMLQFMPLGLVGLLMKNFPEEFNHELILAVSSMQSPRARKVAALNLCQLTIADNRLNSKSQCWLGFRPI